MKVRQNYEILICTKMCTCTCGFSFRARHEKYLSNHLLSAPSYCTVTVGCFFHENTHTYERITMEIDKRENFQDIFIDTL